jgi:hypothetical protein
MDCKAESKFNCDGNFGLCEDDIACPVDVEYDCSIERPCGGIEYDCAEEHWMFDGSTMFNGTTPMSPTQTEINRIQNRWVFRSSQC